ncbi:PREDICTED: histone H2A deubiquitinase MYSM1 isoform X1 [Crocodylus porosus]|uniref:Myb-like, SWIRM and MPN domain-containing protein 1 n=1 Tax=Crocodylus porosus TaxID=8502 RepID=A0A7M4EDK3_CROPO|nr:PREDICTED: histone H2A deubiquitinase MYSM1 isoform X1 [Crocodylus porosus]
MAAAEEADVDVEGDAAMAAGGGQPGDYGNTASGLLQDHYLSSSWRTDNGLPWTLDSTISEENRAVIEKMLLEEEYYLSNKSLPEKIWLEQKDAEKKSMKSPHKKTGKVMARSPTKSASYSLKWTIEEKELFEQGLAKFGRRWTKIAKLIGSRTVLQVKSYARQFFKNKAKIDTEKEDQSEYSSTSFPIDDENGEKAETWALTNLRGRADPNLNAVKIEKLSDDEEVDITDEMDELLAYAPQQEPEKFKLTDSHKSLIQETGGREHTCSSAYNSAIPLTAEDLLKTEQGKVETLELSNVVVTCSEKQSINGDESVKSEYWQFNKFPERNEQDRRGTFHGSSQWAGQELNEEQKDLADTEMLFHASHQVDEENQEEAEELKPPEQEVEIDRNVILEEEKQAIPEFFEGRQAKTPERYLKIRNYILDQWERCKPKYLNKTSVRPGLKNCGDVNCIGRIHTYLELIGAINFGCEQAVYNRPQPADKTRSKEGKDTIEAYQLAQRLQSMRTRRRRVRDPWGNWCDARDLEGQTFEHLSAEELARRREEEKLKPAKPSKGSRQMKSSFDPFQLIPCCLFTAEKQEPFQVKVASEALLIMDLHSHVSMAEVIGLLGGRYSEADRIVEICAAEPCNSLSTGLQCEMDPVSQTQASEMLAVRGYSVIGWYHSHPAFDPNPSIRDIDTQAKYQSYFSRGGAMFIGMIISPYNRNNPLPYSQITCLVISDEISSDGSYRLPYKFEIQQMLDEPQWELVFEKTRWIIEKYRLSYSSVPMDKIFHRDSDLTCLQKLLECMRKTLGKVTNCFIAEEFLTQIENLFLSSYKSEKQNDAADENKSMCPNELLM